jgi:hypothetical protein
MPGWLPAIRTLRRFPSRSCHTDREELALRSPHGGNRVLSAWRQPTLPEINAVQVSAVVGFLWLLAYTFTDWARQTSLAVIWRLELWVADALGVAIRPSAAAGSNEPLVWVAILGAYCLASIWLAASAVRPTPSIEDYLDTDSPLPRGNR